MTVRMVICVLLHKIKLYLCYEATDEITLLCHLLIITLLIISLTVFFVVELNDFFD